MKNQMQVHRMPFPFQSIEGRLRAWYFFHYLVIITFLIPYEVVQRVLCLFSALFCFSELIRK
jgi:hypothetical protein